MKCMKCQGSATIILRKKDSYCESCFITSTNHKFRACIGKSKLISANQNILVCLSGGIGSTVLKNLIYNGMLMDNNKRLRIIPIFLHLIDTEADKKYIQVHNIINQCKKLNFDIHLASLSDYLDTNTVLPAVNIIPEIKSNEENKFFTMIKSLPATATNDFKQKIKRKLYIRFARVLDCSFIFTAETTTGLAINLLSNLALGRGSQIDSDVGFCDARNENLRIIRPMKDISKEELDCYVKIKQLAPSNHEDLQVNSLQSVIRSFVTDLQENFPATISTVCRTADKICVYDKYGTEGKCDICESNLDAESTKLTALNATKFSRTVSSGKYNTENFEVLEEDGLFPLIHKRLCYGCSRNHYEMEKNGSSSVN